MNKYLLAFKIECLLIGIVIIIFFVNSLSSLLTLTTVILGILTTFFGFLISNRKNINHQFLQVGNHLVKIILTFSFPTTLLTAISLLSSLPTTSRHLAWLTLTLTLIIFGGALLPFIKAILLPISQPSWQIAIGILFMTILPASFMSLRYLNATITFTIQSPIIWIFILTSLAITTYVMIYWGYQLPRLKINKDVDYRWLLLAVITLLLNLGLSAGSWSRLFFHFDLTLTPGPLYLILFTIIWTGIKEEFMFRYVFLWPLASLARGPIESRVFWSSLISSLVFGVFHAQNINSQGVLQTCLQIFAAFGIGFLFSVITLYTGTIWISIIIHSMIDLIGFPATNSVFTGKTSLFLIEFIIATRVIELIVAFLLIRNKKNQQAFSTTLNRLRQNQLNF
ncbi:CPBP family intramembrane glutamic endopeptidase [Lentilactobacillus raoultii]|uniref:CPBP family intramembrane glutamic endopeptidase n=1 Tax=Lentilactobacillus raoultii TaxID=1987503 RepID=A0ABW3PPB4_9LACO|nr:CPBP family intramembrane glutamic endopeptidase [Lentilactobacillus raoultii]